MIEKVIKHYKKLTNVALKKLVNEENFKLEYDERLIDSNVKTFFGNDSSHLSKELIFNYKLDMKKMINRANREYNKVLYKLKATNNIETKQAILKKFADSGIIGFEAKNGAKWNIETYSNMYTRHVNNETVRNNVIYLAKEQNKNIVKISKHGTKCELCKPFEGRILTLEELEIAKSKGLFHPNCLHIVLFVIGKV